MGSMSRCTLARDVGPVAVTVPAERAILSISSKNYSVLFGAFDRELDTDSMSMRRWIPRRQDTQRFRHAHLLLLAPP